MPSLDALAVRASFALSSSALVHEQASCIAFPRFESYPRIYQPRPEERALARVSKDGHKRDRASGHPSRRRFAPPLRMRSVPPLPLSERSLTRTPAGLGCTTAPPSCRRLRCAGAATSNHRRVVEHSDGDCSDDYGDAQHERHHAGVGPVANAATVRPLSLAFLVQRSIPLRPRGERYASFVTWWARSRSRRGAASSFGLRNRLCSSRSKSAIR